MNSSNKPTILIQALILAACFPLSVHAGGFFDNLTQGIGSVVGEITKNEEEKDLPQSVQDAQDRDRGTGAALGAGAGAIIGKIVGKDSESTAIGAVIGTVVGVAAGQNMATKRGNYAKEYYDVNSAITNTEKRVFELQRQEREIERSIRLRRSEISELRQQISKGQQVASRKRRLLNDLQVDIAKAEQTRKQLRKDVKLVEKELEDIDAAMQSSSNVDELEQAKVELIAQRDSMLVTLNKLNGMGDELRNQQQAIDNA